MYWLKLYCKYSNDLRKILEFTGYIISMILIEIWWDIKR